MAKALFEKIPIDVPMSPLLLRLLCQEKKTGIELTLEDMKSYDYQMYQSLKYIQDDPNLNMEEEDFKFSILNYRGEEIDLIPNGKDIKVKQS
mmetsp:Transcript_13551/g.13285  ORF Transcript_13551/g.13285 Transcript_13551/m.13285 type:complete len:92 (+) Transcript_13551:1177-1452(+)